MDGQIPPKHRTSAQISARPALQPAACARHLLRKLNVQAIPIQPRQIAEQLQIVVGEREVESQYDGCLMRVGDAWGILLNSLIQSQSRKNFTIAHELGHYQLDWGQTLQHRCRHNDLRAFGSHQFGRTNVPISSRLSY